MSRKHHVRSHHWINGVLSTVDNFFEELEEAIQYANDSGSHTVKVYTPDGELVHVKTPTATETYA